MQSRLKRWFLDPPDTRDWDLANRSRCDGSQISSKILSRIRVHRDTIKADRRKGRPLRNLTAGDFDYESLPDFGSIDFPVASAVLWALVLKESESFGQPIAPQWFPALTRQCSSCYGNRENGIRDMLRTVARIGANRFNETPVPGALRAAEDKQKLFGNLQFYRLDRPLRPGKKNRLFDWVTACLAAKLPVLFSVPLMNFSLTPYMELDEEAPSLTDQTRPIGQHPVVGFESVKYIDPVQKWSKELLRNFGKPRQVNAAIRNSTTGIRVRNFTRDELGSNGFAIIPEWYFHFGLVQDCWVIIKPDPVYLEDAC